MGNWTPGPWHADGHVYDSQGSAIAYLNRGSKATLAILPEHAARKRADAQLIAAAPELYAALEALSEYVIAVCDVDEAARSYHDDIFNRVHVAFAKARGESKPCA